MNNENDKTAFLNKIRQALAYSEGPQTPLPSADNLATTRLVPSNDLDLVETFTRHAVAAGMVVHRLMEKTTVQPKITDLIKQLDIHTLLIDPDPLLESLHLRETLSHMDNIQLLDWQHCSDPSAPAAFEAQAGISAPAFAVAETGSFVLQSSPHASRLLAIAPPVHIAILPTDRILPDLLDLLQPDRIPRGTFTLVTGPSKTADIEMTLITGAHGPTAEHILLIG